jgi:hypothetical protein
MNLLAILMPFFVPSTTQYGTFERRYDSDGKVFAMARAHAALTAKTPYKLIANEYGPVTAALADGVLYYTVIVPVAAVASGADFWGQIGGYCASMVTPSLSVSVGHALSILDGAVADAGADYSGAAGEFAVNVTATTTATAHNVMLVPERILETT